MTKDDMPDKVWAYRTEFGDVRITGNDILPEKDRLREYVPADLAQTPADKSPGSPLIKRTTDEQGNKLVVLAEWYYEEIIGCLPDEEPPAGDVEALKREVFDACFGNGQGDHLNAFGGAHAVIDHLHQRGLIGGGWIEDTLIAAYETGQPDKVWEVVEKHLIDREPKRHRWAGEGEKCADCGESDWYAGPVCTPPAGQGVRVTAKEGRILSADQRYHQKTTSGQEG